MWPSKQGTTAVFVVFLLCFSYASSYRFLAVLHTAARSHHIVGSALMKALARKGHDVTVISPFPLKEPIPNYHDIPLPTVIKAMEGDLANILDVLKRTIVENLMVFHDMGIRITQTALEESTVKDLMNSNQTFDAVICEVFLSEALYGLSEHFNAPLIGFGTFGATIWNTDMIGSPSPPSYVPNPLLQFTDHMTLLQRVGNLAFNTFERIFYDWHYFPRQEALYKEHFPHLNRPLQDIRKNAALILLNQHVSLSFPRPYMPNQIEVGGLHINRQRTLLPAEIQHFLDEAREGAIYFSMGSNLKSTQLPLEKRQIILNTFRSLKQRVLWKFEDTNLEGKPDNVLISPWFPQDDVLAHRNVRIFITHGGLLSTTESIYHGKPVIGIPIFGDQFLNMGRAVMNGYGIMLDYGTLSVESFKEAIEDMLYDPSYRQQVQAMSARYRDQGLNPLERAIYWVEHVVRHKGARYLHCAGLELNFLEYHNIDAMLVLYGGIIVVLFLFFFLLRKFLGLLQIVCAKKDKKVKSH